jgi:hypothetical protein
VSVARNASHGVVVVSWRKVREGPAVFVHERWGNEGGTLYRMRSERECLTFIRERAMALKRKFWDLEEEARAAHPHVRVRA